LKEWHDHYVLESKKSEEDHETTVEESKRWDKTATSKIRRKYIKGSFPIGLDELKIPYGSAFIFNAKEDLHAGGPGKSGFILLTDGLTD
jgi:hypothetical protein